MIGQAKAVDIFRRLRFRIGHENLSCRLLDDSACNPAFEGILRALSREADLVDCLFLILDAPNENSSQRQIDPFWRLVGLPCSEGPQRAAEEGRWN